VLLIPLAAWDAFIVLGGFFSMSNADSAISDNWTWFIAGPFSFLPALIVGISSVLIFRAPVLKELQGWGRYVMWLPLAWLVIGSCQFTRVQLWGSGFARSLPARFYIPLIPVPMLLAALCLWTVRIRRVDKDDASESYPLGTGG
jgi:hypothetical protein